MADWAGERLGLSFIPPGEPWRNGYVESFNSRVRDECLNINLFWSLTHAKIVISDWKTEYNHHRRHSALGYQAPARYAATCTHPMNTTRLSLALARFMGSRHWKIVQTSNGSNRNQCAVELNNALTLAWVSSTLFGWPVIRRYT
jgi:hypothetical protein